MIHSNWENQSNRSGYLWAISDQFHCWRKEIQVTSVSILLWGKWGQPLSDNVEFTVAWMSGHWLQNLQKHLVPRNFRGLYFLTYEFLNSLRKHFVNSPLCTDLEEEAHIQRFECFNCSPVGWLVFFPFGPLVPSRFGPWTNKNLVNGTWSRVYGPCFLGLFGQWTLVPRQWISRCTDGNPYKKTRSSNNSNMNTALTIHVIVI